MNQVQRFGRMELSKEKKSANTVNHFLRDRKDKQNMLHFLTVQILIYAIFVEGISKKGKK